MESRIKKASDLFLVVVDRETGKIAGFLNGLATDREHLTDDFFTDANLHDPEGVNIMPRSFRSDIHEEPSDRVSALLRSYVSPR